MTYKDCFRYPGLDSPESISLSDSEGLVFATPGIRTFDINKGWPDQIPYEQVHHLQVYEARAGNIKSLPEYMHRFTNLKSLSLSSELLTKTQASNFPNSIEAIYVYMYNFTFPASLFLPNLKWFFTSGLPWKCVPECTPNLRFLTNILDRKMKELESIAQLKRLLAIAVGPIQDLSAFDTLSALELESLDFHGSKISSIQGIEKIAALKSVGIADVHGMENLDNLFLLQNLQEFSHVDCENVKSIAELLLCRSLKKVTIEGGSILDSGSVAAVRANFAERNLIFNFRKK